MNTSNRNFLLTIKIGIFWILIAAILYFIFDYLESKSIDNKISMGDGTVEIQRSRDGHYYWTGEINRVPVTFLIDTGASITAIPEKVAQQANLQLGRSIELSTANGIRQSHLVKADLCLKGNVCIDNLSMTVLDDEYGLLGMNVINRMKWSQSNGVMSFHAPE